MPLSHERTLALHQKQRTHPQSAAPRSHRREYPTGKEALIVRETSLLIAECEAAVAGMNGRAA
jgi:hypothetical protein